MYVKWRHIFLTFRVNERGLNGFPDLEHDRPLLEHCLDLLLREHGHIATANPQHVIAFLDASLADLAVSHAERRIETQNNEHKFMLTSPTSFVRGRPLTNDFVIL